ncbi:MAG: hypothetical protein JW874_03575 [Spirochaetales bacterium]|nr:hypothetical protein [Spirochaetales bacterium]
MLYDFAIRYEFSCEDPIQYINITVVRTDGITGELVVYDSPEPIRAPRNGTIWFNRGSDTPFILLVTGEYRVDAVLMSDRYGTPQEINSLRASDSFSIMP